MSLLDLDLDDRTWTDLVAELESLIPSFAPDWTDYNASDVGITLVELFAWLAEMLIFRANQIPERHLVTFLRLLNGPDWAWAGTGDPVADAQALAGEVNAAITAIRVTQRAITPADFVTLALQTNRADPTLPQVARATCVPRRFLDASLQDDRPGHVTVVVVPDRTLDQSTTDTLHAAVHAYLDGPRLLTTQVHVSGPLVAPLSVEVQVAPQSDASDDAVTSAITAALVQLFDPSSASPWPFGRGVYVSTLYEVLDALPAVDYVASLTLSNATTAGAGMLPATELWNDAGELVGLELGPYQLPQLTAAEVTVYVGRVYVAIEVDVSIQAASGADPLEIRRAVQSTLRNFFHPASAATPNGPTGTAPWGPIPIHDLQVAIEQVPGVRAADPPTVTSTPDRNDPDALGNPRLLLQAGEFVELQSSLTLV